MTTITIKNGGKLKKTTFESLNELWLALQDNFPLNLYEIAEEDLTKEELAAYEKHKKSDKTEYTNFQG